MTGAQLAADTMAWHLERIRVSSKIRASVAADCSRDACIQNGALDGKGIPAPTTKQGLCDWLNRLAYKMGIARSDRNPGGYFATIETVGR